MFGQKTENTPLTIRIECEGHTTLEIDELLPLQNPDPRNNIRPEHTEDNQDPGGLKKLSEENYVKLRNSMTEFGFSFPIFYWQDENNEKWIVDAHQRIQTLLKMREEGWTIPDLPADRIFAKNRTEAKKKLLVLNSRYGEITDSGLTDFLNEEGFEIPFEDISDYLEFPEMRTDDGNPPAEPKVNEIICPACSHKFVYKVTKKKKELTTS